jgi:hypothetical protein
MSNNKQSMKLYTEEQLVNTIEAIRDYLKNYPEKFNESMIEKHLKNLEPIELPSDESLKDKLFNLADEFAFAGYGKTAVILHTIHNGLGNNEQEGGNNEQQ